MEFWPNADPLGKTFRDYQGNTLEVIGIARDVLTQRLDAPDEPVIYAKWNPNDGPEVHQLFVRFSGDEAAITRAVSGAIREMAPEIYVRMKTIQEMIDRTIELIGRLGLLVTLLGVIAVVLTVIGIYGIVTFAVAQRTREIGIRIALGAEKTHIYSAIIGSSGRPVALGLLIGLGHDSGRGLGAVADKTKRAICRKRPRTYQLRRYRHFIGDRGAGRHAGSGAAATKVDPMVALRCE